MAREIITPAVKIMGATHVISDEQFDQIQDILDGNTPVTEKSGSITFRAAFGNSIEIDINVVLVRDDDCTGNSYIEAIMYEDNIEVVNQFDPVERLGDEDFVFVHDDTTYIFTIMRGSTYDELMYEKSLH